MRRGDRIQGGGLPQVGHLNNHDTSVYLVYCPQQMVVIFPRMDRGSSWDCGRGALRGVVLG